MDVSLTQPHCIPQAGYEEVQWISPCPSLRLPLVWIFSLLLVILEVQDGVAVQPLDTLLLK